MTLLLFSSDIVIPFIIIIIIIIIIIMTSFWNKNSQWEIYYLSKDQREVCHSFFVCVSPKLFVHWRHFKQLITTEKSSALKLLYCSWCYEKEVWRRLTCVISTLESPFWRTTLQKSDSQFRIMLAIFSNDLN